MVENHRIAAPGEWREARLRLLQKEKEFTRLRDELTRARQALPWEPVEKAYVFDGPEGPETLAQLFAGASQLVVYHFMFAPDWGEGCPSCSWWAENFDRNVDYLLRRDVSMVAISRAPVAKLAAFGQRKGWGFKWLSCGGNGFAEDFCVSFQPEQLAAGPVDYNYRALKTTMSDLPGISVFYRRPDDGTIFHTYSCYSRGLDMLNAGYHYLDLVPKGRDEDGLPYRQAWVREANKYGGS